MRSAQTAEAETAAISDVNNKNSTVTSLVRVALTNFDLSADGALEGRPCWCKWSDLLLMMMMRNVQLREGTAR